MDVIGGCVIAGRHIPVQNHNRHGIPPIFPKLIQRQLKVSHTVEGSGCHHIGVIRILDGVGNLIMATTFIGLCHRNECQVLQLIHLAGCQCQIVVGEFRIKYRRKVTPDPSVSFIPVLDQLNIPQAGNPVPDIVVDDHSIFGHNAFILRHHPDGHGILPQLNGNILQLGIGKSHEATGTRQLYLNMCTLHSLDGREIDTGNAIIDIDDIILTALIPIHVEAGIQRQRCAIGSGRIQLHQVGFAVGQIDVELEVLRRRHHNGRRGGVGKLVEQTQIQLVIVARLVVMQRQCGQHDSFRSVEPTGDLQIGVNRTLCTKLHQLSSGQLLQNGLGHQRVCPDAGLPCLSGHLHHKGSNIIGGSPLLFALPGGPFDTRVILGKQLLVRSHKDIEHIPVYGIQMDLEVLIEHLGDFLSITAAADRIDPGSLSERPCTDGLVIPESDRLVGSLSEGVDRSPVAVGGNGQMLLSGKDLHRLNTTITAHIAVICLGLPVIAGIGEPALLRHDVEDSPLGKGSLHGKDTVADHDDCILIRHRVKGPALCRVVKQSIGLVIRRAGGLALGIKAVSILPVHSNQRNNTFRILWQEVQGGLGIQCGVNIAHDIGAEGTLNGTAAHGHESRIRIGFDRVLIGDLCPLRVQIGGSPEDINVVILGIHATLGYHPDNKLIQAGIQVYSLRHIAVSAHSYRDRAAAAVLIGHILIQVDHGSVALMVMVGMGVDLHLIQNKADTVLLVRTIVFGHRIFLGLARIHRLVAQNTEIRVTLRQSIIIGELVVIDVVLLFIGVRLTVILKLHLDHHGNCPNINSVDIHISHVHGVVVKAVTVASMVDTALDRRSIGRVGKELTVVNVDVDLQLIQAPLGLFLHRFGQSHAGPHQFFGMGVVVSGDSVLVIIPHTIHKLLITIPAVGLDSDDTQGAGVGHHLHRVIMNHRGIGVVERHQILRIHCVALVSPQVIQLNSHID